MISTEAMVRRARRALAACVCVAIAAAFALSAAAPAQAWSPYINIAQQQGTFFPKVGMDPAGNAVFMWERIEPDGIFTRSRVADGSLSPIQRITASGSSGEHALAVDRQGNAYYVWDTIEHDGDHARARVRDADGTLSPVQTLATEPGSIGDPTVGVDASGRAVFAWRSSRQRGSGLIQARSRSASGKLSPVHTVARQSGVYFDMGVDADGNATFVWEDRTDGGLAEFTRVLGPNGDLGPTKRISRVGDKAFPPAVEVTPSGRAVFAWLEGDPETGPTTLVTRARAANGSFQPTQVLSRLDASAQTFLGSQLAVAPTGEAVFCWEADGALHARTRAPGGALGPMKTIAPVRASCRPGVDSDGNLAFAWDAFVVGSKDRVFARSVDAAGHLRPTRALSPAGVNSSSPELAVTPAGAAAVVWPAGNRGFAIQASFGP